MDLPSDRILGRRLVERGFTRDDAAGTPSDAEMLYLASLLLADENGRLTMRDVTQRAPELLELGRVEIQALDEDPAHVVIRFRAHAVARTEEQASG